MINIKISMMNESHALYITYVDLRSYYKVINDALKREIYPSGYREELKVKLIVVKDVLRTLISAYRKSRHYGK